MNGLSPRQAEIYQFILDYRQKRDISPTFREIASATMLSLTSVVAHIQAMKAKGCIDWEPNSARSIHVVKQGAT
jgi:SOS-response transcriptional repressor LexA